MKNFSDLLGTDPHIDIEIQTYQGVIRYRWNLLEPLDLSCPGVQSVLVDGMEMLNFGYVENDVWQVHHDEPFYRWRHRITGQGWLLDPVKSEVPGSNGI